MRRSVVFCSCLLWVAACKGQAGHEGAPAAASGAPSAVPSAAVPPSKPWYEGTWKGKYDARHYKIEMAKKDGMIKQWAEDDGKQASGAGELILNIDAAGQVSGTAAGPLGAMQATGEVDGDVLRVKLEPADPAAQGALGGFLLANKKGDAFSGTIQASSGDSLVVRDAPVDLAKQAGGAAAR